MNGPTLRELALRTLLPAFPGTTAPPWALRLVRDGLGGFALFGNNIADLDQVAALTASLRRARPDVVIATDEEGGDVTRLCYAHGSPYPGNAALGVVDDVDLTRAIYRCIGAELAAVGITLDMAPAVDVNSSDDNPAIGTRSFGADPRRVSAHAVAAVTGLQEAGVAACAKHFPGHGATEMDSHLDLPVVDATEELLWRRELPPFQAAIAAGVRSVMTAHIRVPVLTGDLPATFSPEALIGLLRKELGFTGAIVSDGLEMRGASGTIGVPEAAVRALVAGNDLLCFGGDFARPPAHGAEAMIEATVTATIDAVRVGRLSEDRLAEAAARNALLGTAEPVPVPAVALPEIITVPGPELGLAAARRALRVEGTLPTDAAAGIVVQLEPPATMAVGEVPWGLSPLVPGVHTLRPVSLPVPSSSALAGVGGAGMAPAQGAPVEALPVGSVEEIIARAGAGPVIVVSRDTHRHPWARDFVEAISARHPAVLLIEMGWPAAWRPAGALGYVATHGASRATARVVADLLFPTPAPAPTSAPAPISAPASISAPVPGSGPLTAVPMP